MPRRRSLFNRLFQGRYAGRGMTVGREFGEHGVGANYHGDELLGRYDLSVGKDMEGQGFHIGQMVYALDPSGKRYGPFRISDPSFHREKGHEVPNRAAVEFRHPSIGRLFDDSRVQLIPAGLPDMPHPAGDRPPTGFIAGAKAPEAGTAPAPTPNEWNKPTQTAVRYKRPFPESLLPGRINDPINREINRTTGTFATRAGRK